MFLEFLVINWSPDTSQSRTCGLLIVHRKAETARSGLTADVLRDVLSAKRLASEDFGPMAPLALTVERLGSPARVTVQ